MRVLILFSLFLFSDNLFCQSINVKCDSFELVYHAKQALIFKKNKVGLYDVINQEYLIKPLKGVIMHLNRYNMALVLDKKRVNVYSYNGKKYTSNTLSKYGYEVDLSFTDTQIDSIKNNFILGKFMMQNFKSGNTTILTPTQFNNLPIESNLNIEQLSENEIIFNYNYHPNYTDLLEGAESAESGFSRSGLYNIAEKKWRIPNKYANCTKIDSFIYCQNYNQDFEIARDGDQYYSPPNVEISYDVYVKRGNEYAIKFIDFKKMDKFSFMQLYDFDSVKFQPDDAHCLTYKAGKVGLFQFDLEHASENVGIGYRPIINKLLPTEYDFVSFENQHNFILSAKDGQIAFWNELVSDNGVHSADVLAKSASSIIWGMDYSGRSICFVDDKWRKLNLPNLSEFERFNQEGIQHNPNSLMNNKGFGLELLTDNKLLITNYESDYIDPFAAPIRSLEYPEEDSVRVDDEGEIYFIYPPVIPGYSNSGVYDLKTKDWFIKPQHHKILRVGDNYVVNSTQRDGEDEAIGNTYSVIQSNGDYLISGISPEQISNHPEKYLNAFVGDNLIPFPERSIYRHEISIVRSAFNNRGSSFNGQYYYVQDAAQKWSVIKPFNDRGHFNNQPIIEPKDFVHFNPSLKYAFYIENDSAFIEIRDTLIAWKLTEGVVNMAVQYVDYARVGVQYDLLVNTNEGNIQSTSQDFDEITYFSTLIIEFSEDKIIINEPQLFDNVSYADGGIYELEYTVPDFDYSLLKIFDAQTSSIWIKENDIWLKKTPYYASIQAMPFGYLVTTGNYNEVINLYDETYKTENGSTIILDANYKAMAFLDYFDFNSGQIHDFGLELCVASGCFLVNNQGKVIMQAEWDKFELENGRIKAIKFSTDYYDYYLEGEDETEYYEKVEYFDLK